MYVAALILADANTFGTYFMYIVCNKNTNENEMSRGKYNNRG